MTDNIEPQNDKESKFKPSAIAAGVAFLLIFIILGVLIVTRNTREDGASTSEGETKEEKVDETAKKSDGTEDTLRRDQTYDTVSEEEPAEEETPSAVTKYPDLYVHEYTVSDDLTQDKEFTVHIEITNKGEADSTGFTWQWWANDDDVECDGDISRLDKGEKATVECEYTYEDYGTFDTKVVIDSGDEVDESNEDNNVMEEELEVAENKYVDLSITEYSFDPVPEKGVPFTVRIGLKNSGNTLAENFVWEWWPTAYNHACKSTITELAAGSTKVVTCDYTYGGWSNYKTAAKVDTEDDIDETDEDNNEYVEYVVPIH